MQSPAENMKPGTLAGAKWHGVAKEILLGDST
jgi:hypothetical protein